MTRHRSDSVLLTDLFSMNLYKKKIIKFPPTSHLAIQTSRIHMRVKLTCEITLQAIFLLLYIVGNITRQKTTKYENRMDLLMDQRMQSDNCAVMNESTPTLPSGTRKMV